jgi:hypothetical protein
MDLTRLRSVRNFYLVATYLITALAGFSRGFHRGGSASLEVAFALAMGLALALLVTSDANLAQRPLPTTVGWLVFFFWPVAAPAAVIISRRGRDVWIALAFGVLILITYAASVGLGLWLAG